MNKKSLTSVPDNMWVSGVDLDRYVEEWRAAIYGKSIAVEAPPYSTDLTTAEALIEAVLEKDKSMSFYLHGSWVEDEIKWTACFRRGNSLVITSLHEETKPMAVVRAFMMLSEKIFMHFGGLFSP